jgi:hypothetical protein
MTDGEGQFIALFKRGDNADPYSEAQDRGKKSKKVAPVKQNKQELEAIATAKKFLEENLACEAVGEIIVLGNRIYLKPDAA